MLFTIYKALARTTECKSGCFPAICCQGKVEKNMLKLLWKIIKTLQKVKQNKLRKKEKKKIKANQNKKPQPKTTKPNHTHNKHKAIKPPRQPGQLKTFLLRGMHTKYLRQTRFLFKKTAKELALSSWEERQFMIYDIQVTVPLRRTLTCHNKDIWSTASWISSPQRSV